jgi:hypothetical protein
MTLSFTKRIIESIKAQRNMTFHNYAGVVFMLWQYLLGFGALPVLAA